MREETLALIRRQLVRGRAPEAGDCALGQPDGDLHRLAELRVERRVQPRSRLLGRFRRRLDGRSDVLRRGDLLPGALFGRLARGEVAVLQLLELRLKVRERRALVAAPIFQILAARQLADADSEEAQRRARPFHCSGENDGQRIGDAANGQHSPPPKLNKSRQALHDEHAGGLDRLPERDLRLIQLVVELVLRARARVQAVVVRPLHQIARLHDGGQFGHALLRVRHLADGQPVGVGVFLPQRRRILAEQLVEAFVLAAQALLQSLHRLRRVQPRRGAQVQRGGEQLIGLRRVTGTTRVLRDRRRGIVRHHGRQPEPVAPFVGQSIQFRQRHARQLRLCGELGLRGGEAIVGRDAVEHHVFDGADRVRHDRVRGRQQADGLCPSGDLPDEPAQRGVRLAGRLGYRLLAVDRHRHFTLRRHQHTSCGNAACISCVRTRCGSFAWLMAYASACSNTRLAASACKPTYCTHTTPNGAKPSVVGQTPGW